MFGCKMPKIPKLPKLPKLPEIPSYSDLKRRVPVKTGMIVIAVLQILVETGLLIGGLYQLFAYSKVRSQTKQVSEDDINFCHRSCG